MEQETQALLSSPLFCDFTEAEARAMLGCLGAERVNAARGARLLDAGEQTARFGLVLSGAVHTVRDGPGGGRSPLSTIGPGGLFAAAYADTGAVLDVSVVAAEPVAALLIPVQRVFGTCMSACPYHIRLVRNFRRALR